MKKQLLLTKVLLIAICLMGGVSSVWGDLVPTSESCDFENSETLFTASGRMTGANAADPSNASNHVYSFTSASNAGNAAPGGFAYYNFSTLTATAAKVDISFDCYIPQSAGQFKVSFGDASVRTSSIFTNKGAWSYNNNGAIFAFGTERGKLDGKNNENYASVNGTNFGSTTTLKANAFLGLWVSVSATVDITNKTVSYTITNKSTAAELVSVENASFYSGAANTCTQLDIQTGINSVTAYIDNVSITSYVDQSEKYANYTIKYMYGETEIKAARIVESIKVGNDATITDLDKASVWYNEEKYIYSSDDAEGKTVAEDGSTVVTVSFRKATVEAYTVNLINSANSEILIENAFSGNVVEGETSTVYYHKAINVGGVWYVRAQNGGEPYYGISVVAGTNTVSYTENSGVSYFFEVEDLPVVKVGSYSGWRNDGLAGRSSGGQAPRHYAKNYAYTDVLEGGIYELVMNARNQSSSVADNIILAYMDENDNIVVLDNQFVDWAKAATAEKTVTVSIPDGARFVLKCGDSNSNLNMDFLMFTRTGDYTTSVTVGANGYTTFASPYALDLTDANRPEGLKAYKATLEGTTLSFTALNQKVPAGTGLLLLGETKGGSYDITVVASGDAVDGNDLTGVTADTPMQSNTEGNYIFVMRKASSADSPLTFAPLSTTTEVTVPAGKAYITVPASAFASPSRNLSISFGDETTSIADVRSKMEDVRGDYYNLQGQRVKAPTKGLYIVNGKKVIMK